MKRKICEQAGSAALLAPAETAALPGVMTIWDQVLG
jgi:hypothetical protein